MVIDFSIIMSTYFNFYSYWMHFLVGMPIGITSSVIRLKICVIAARIRKYKSLIKKKKKNMIKQYC